MENIKNYEDSVRHLDDRRSIVCLRINSVKNQQQLLYVGTGIVVASEDRSCFIMTSVDFNKKLRGNVGSVEFFDGTVHAIESNRCITRNEIGIFYVMKHCESITFSANEVVQGQKIFSIGYNYNSPDRRYISEDIVCGANIVTEEGTQFVHGSSTGKHGHQGSAVFNEEGQLVGMNFFYTRSSNINYSGDNESAIGGLVSALNVHTISCRLRYACFHNQYEDMSLDDALERLRTILRQAQERLPIE